MKKAVVVVSVGTSRMEAEQSCIRPVEQALERAFAQWDVFRAYSSRGILEKLRAQGRPTAGVKERLRQLQEAGYDRILIAPTHILRGREYESIRQAAGETPIAEPLLACDADFAWMASLLSEIAAEEDRPLLMMGHGADHAADSAYARLQAMLPRNVHIACIKGDLALKKQLAELDALPCKRITLAPLMLTAGEHARSDMAGEGADSWKSILEGRGFEVRIRMQGLGALAQVQERFVDKAQAAARAAFF